MPRIAGNQAADRHPADDYPTDDRWTRILLDNVALRGEVWEPAAGEGRMAKVLAERYQVRATDLYGDPPVDFLDCSDMADTIVTNPPYRLLDDFIVHGLAQSREMLCLLMGWHFLAGGAGRVSDIWRPNPPDRILVVPQRMHVGGKPSQFNHAWVVWDHRRPARAPSLEWFPIRGVPAT